VTDPTMFRVSPVMSCCSARNFLIAARFAKFRPLPLRSLRFICHRRRSATSPVAVPEIFCSLFASQNFDRCHSLLLPLSATGGGRKRPHFDTYPYIHILCQIRISHLKLKVNSFKLKKSAKNIFSKFVIFDVEKNI